MRTIAEIIIHCSDTYPNMDIGAEQIRRWHVEENNWQDIGYHYVIRRNGKIETGRDESVMGAHARRYNANSIGICLVGGKAQKERPPTNFTIAQWDSLAYLVRALKEKYPDSKIIGHNDVSNKQCPTFDVSAWAEGL